jgi:hypothetical protein
MRAFLLGCALGMAAPDAVDAWQFPDSLDMEIDSAESGSQAAAQPALDTLLRLLHPGNIRAMGFQELADTSSTTLGKPLAILLVPLKGLRGFRPQDNPWGLVRRSRTIFYPVLVRGRARSAVVLGEDASRWRAVSYGGANAAMRSANAISIADSLLGPGSRRYFRVDVLVPRTRFIGFEQARRLILVPLIDDRQGRWQVGVPLPAELVFAQLAPEAIRYNEMPQ